MIVVDSSVWIGYFNGVRSRETDLLDALLDTEVLIVGDLVLTEVLQGFRDDEDHRRAEQALAELDFRPMVGREIALKSARNYRWLRGRGVTVRKTIDVIIGTFCIENELSLLHDDRDFDSMRDHLGLATL